MRFVAFATDYDETLAGHGVAQPETLRALERLKASGRKLLLVTGRDLDDLKQVFPEHAIFDAIVAENGGLLYLPDRKVERRLGEPPPAAFVEALRGHGVTPLGVGRVIVATRVPYETVALEEIRRLGLELQVIFNKGAVMVLPGGINKGTGVRAALAELGLSPRNCVAVGDAENDHVFLSEVELGAAVANALPTLKDRADVVLRGAAEEGVHELIEQLLEDDLRALAARCSRRNIRLGDDERGESVALPPTAGPLLFAGTPGSGKSTAAMGFIERVLDGGYQSCIVDPEGDFERFERTVQLGDAKSAPTVQEVAHALEKPGEQIVVNLLAVPLSDRPAFTSKLLLRLQELRARIGRPHWILLDEAHHLVPALAQATKDALSQDLHGTALVTVAASTLARGVLDRLQLVAGVGPDAAETLHDFYRAAGVPAPPRADARPSPGEVLLWSRGGGTPRRVRLARTRAKHQRHLRKYAQGELGPERSFYFRGAEQKLKLRAQNLVQFGQLAEGVDDDTWLHHLRQGDYSRWFRDEVKDEDLARAAEQIERDRSLSARASRTALRAAIEQRYTVPAEH